jgi:predicted RNA-binding protein with PIN domain/Arc/MetJ family transcription regulator
MAYIIDGHNLIGVLPDIHLHQPDDEARLLDKLRAYRAHRGGAEMLVFFDSGPSFGAGGRPGLASSPGVEVRFSGPGQSADDAIDSFLASCRQPGQYAVVTNDQGLTARVRARGASVLSASEFVRQIRPKPPSQTSARDAGEPEPNPRDPAFADLFKDFLEADKAARMPKHQRGDAATWIERLYTGDPQLAERAAQWLGLNGGDRAVEPLRDALTHRDAGVRAAAALALGVLRRRSAVRDLCSELLEDGNSMVREAAAQALGQIGDRAAVTTLESAVKKDTKSKVRKAAAAALEQIRARHP